MARALLYLRVTSLVGQVSSRLRRLKQPKYLAGAVVGGAYVYLNFVRRLGSHGGRGLGSAAAPIPDQVLALFPIFGALILLVILAVNWATPRTAALAFSEAEIAFLFPAPVNRRMLVHYRLLGSQLGMIFTALVLTLVLGRGRSLGGNPWFHAIGWWLILATLNLHFTGTSFVYSKVLNRSLTSGWRKVATVTAIWLVICALIIWIYAVIQLPQQGDFSAQDFPRYLAAQMRGPLPWLLAIPKLVVAPYFAGNGTAFVLALGPALVVLAAHYFWVVHTEVSFEEASIARAEKRAARKRAVQKGDWRGQGAARKAQRQAFRLQAQGRPEAAFLWKNLLSASALFRPNVAIGLFVVVVVGCTWLVRQPELQALRFVVLMMSGSLLAMTLLIGPMLARQDLRSDLLNVDILKTYPLRGWQIVAGELLAPLSILSAVIWLCLLVGFLLFPGDKVAWLTPSLRGAAALGLAILAPPLVAIQLLVSNAAAVVFPAWTQSAGSRAERGIEVLGQRIIFIAGQLLITVIAMGPAVLSAALVFFVAQWLAGVVIAAVVAVGAVFLLLCAEACLGVRWLGGRFEKFDLSAELRV
jgi:ABC-2 type transport system permease protein